MRSVRLLLPLGALAGVLLGPRVAASAVLTVCNAGSLAAPFAAALQAFRDRRPGVDPHQESAGSLDLVRRMIDLGRPCDVLAVADFEVLPALVLPAHAAWYVVFARNRLVLAHRAGAPGADELGRVPWYEILLRPGIEQGHSDPDADPAGYRTLLAWQLAERHYRVPGLAERLRSAVPARNVRPKSVELVALAQTGELDYLWTYRSVAEQAGLGIFALPPEIDLGDPTRASDYAKVSVEVRGSEPGSRRTIRGLPILYALTIPRSAPNPEAAEAFVAFLLGADGRALLGARGLDLIAPAQASEPSALPPALRDGVVPLALRPPAS